uniref:C-type lectin domain-containing protein n=1 Tax=Anopheles funestus TaxID=62324 RepID=A0A182RX35_ANOFN
MKFTKLIFGVITVIMFCMIIDTEPTFSPRTALEMIHQKLCVCPCGNPKGGKLYTVPNMRLNWFEAVAHCNSIGMSIASIKDANDRRLLQMYLQRTRYNLRSQVGNQSPYWIGANNLAANNGLRWGVSNQEVTTSEWNPTSVPSNDRSEPFCVYIKAESMQWTPAQCDGEQRQFICEY